MCTSLAMEEICRTCLTNSVALVDIFTDHRQPSLAIMLSECVTSIQIQPNDELPQKICVSCICDIQNAFALKRRCEKSYQVLCDKLKKSKMLEETIKEEMPEDDQAEKYILLSTEYILQDDQVQYKIEEQDNCIASNNSIVLTIEGASDQMPPNLQVESNDTNNQSELLVTENYEMTESDMDIGSVKIENINNVRQQQADQTITQAKEVFNEEQHKDINSNLTQLPSKEVKKVQFLCPHCPKTFTQKCHLNSHIRTHTGERPYKCTHCTKAFSQASNLRKHMCIHSGERPFKCPHCSRAFTRHTDLQYHVSTHPGKQAYKCSNCIRYFIQESELEEHMRYHNGERTYKCQECPKEYALAWQLQRHIRTHTGEQPFKCAQCPKTCVDKGDLARHIRSHTGERPYNCPHCQKAFTRAGYLKQHLSTHTEST